ncbi:MAG: hypothetical protein ACI9Z3_002277 [Roseivirga sp.]|jgi:hypothetical protein
MKIRTVFGLLAMVLVACNPDKTTQINQAEITFKTSDSSKLYFKNIRQSYYDKEEMEAAKLEVFRFKKREQGDERPVINLSIVNNWRYDEAYILLEPNGYIQQDTLKLRWKSSDGLKTDSVIYARGNKMDIVKFADQVYQQIQSKSEFEIELEGKWQEILNESQDREAFRITMFDYYNLVQRL